MEPCWPQGVGVVPRWAEMHELEQSKVEHEVRNKLHEVVIQLCMAPDEGAKNMWRWCKGSDAHGERTNTGITWGWHTKNKGKQKRIEIGSTPDLLAIMGGTGWGNNVWERYKFGFRQGNLKFRLSLIPL
jgi:hypothetical protein